MLQSPIFSELKIGNFPGRCVASLILKDFDFLLWVLQPCLLYFALAFFVVRTALLAIIGFMPTHGNGAIGSLDYTPEERKVLAKK